MEQIKRLKELELHDVPVDTITFRPEENKIQLELSKYNDQKEMYDKYTLNFKEIEKIESDKFTFESFHKLEIAHCEASKMEKGYKIGIIFLTMASEPTWQLNLLCTSIEIIKQ